MVPCISEAFDVPPGRARTGRSYGSPKAALPALPASGPRLGQCMGWPMVRRVSTIRKQRPGSIVKALA